MEKELLQQNLQKLMDKALAMGASAAKVVSVPQIKTGAWTRMKCQYGCPNYGATLCCPPYTPDYEATQKFLSEYAYGIIVEYTMELPEGAGPGAFTSADLKMSNGLLEILLGLERDAFLLNNYRAFALKAGRCRLCDKCNLQKCVNPTKARPSLEACGIDVFALANDNGFKMEVITGPIKELKIYGLLLVE
ncbi:DUF2284 domain-containing protein [Phascolarctobacterium sp.]|uniref:DUF2284 domain-containing protein n=1 Tax=Phascolarctobacterium sp. TaxID=2049039 RepID=UPI00386B0C07